VLQRRDGGRSDSVNVLHYYPAALLGEFGTSNAVRGWCTALADAGTNVTLLAIAEEGVVAPPVGVHLDPLPEGKWGFYKPRFLRERLENADVLVLHGGWGPQNILAAAEARRAGVQYVVTAHGVYDSHVFSRGKIWAKRAWWPIIERRHLERALAVHVFFDTERAHLTSTGIRRFVVAPNGYQAPEGVRWEPDPDGFLLWLGRFDPEHKGLDLLLRGLRLLTRGERPRVRLVGVDWRGRKAAVSGIVQDLGLGKDVSVEPPLHGDAKWAALARARGFMYPSRWEAFGVAVAEAVSIGVPTLVTPFPLGRFLAARGGAISRAPEPRALADGVRRLLEPDSASIGRRGAGVIREELAWDRVVGSWLRQVGALLANSRRPTR
jgi:glycosyltransferase involved in cell wall biosynthesis